MNEYFYMICAGILCILLDMVLYNRKKRRVANKIIFKFGKLQRKV